MEKINEKQKVVTNKRNIGIIKGCLKDMERISQELSAKEEFVEDIPLTFELEDGINEIKRIVSSIEKENRVVINPCVEILKAKK